MAKKPDETWQAPLLLRQPLPEEKADPHVEYEPSVIRRRAAAEAPWWQRVRQIESHAKPMQPTLSWGAQWLKLIASEGWLEGLRAGQRIVLETSIRGLDIHPGVVEAASAGGKTKPQRVQLRLAPLTSADWARLVRQVIEDRTDDAVCAGLQASQIPMALVDAADHHGLALLPRRLSSIVTACTCGGAQLPCDHVLAVHLVLGRKLDAEPLAILRLRGGDVAELTELIERVREEIQALVRPAVAAASVDPLAPGKGDPPDWTLLAETAPVRPPLPLPEGWRARETVDALVRRVLSALREKL